MLNQDSFEPRINIDDLSARVAFALPFCLYLSDGIYQITRKGWTASVHLEQISQTNPDPRLGIDQAVRTELVRDRYGRLQFSMVTVELPGKAVIENELRRRVASGELNATNGVVSIIVTHQDIFEFSNLAFQEALAVVNRLIEVYRHITDEFHVRRVPSGEIFQRNIQWYWNNEPVEGTYQMTWGSGLTLLPGFDARTLDDLNSWLNSLRPIPIVSELFCDAKDHLDREEYRLAIIDARTALEVFVDDILLNYFASLNTPLEDACRILDVERRKVQDIEEALQLASINRKLGHALKHALNLDLHNGKPQLWQSWGMAKKLRETGVHRGREIGRSDAIEAVNVIGEIMDNIIQAQKSTSWSPSPSDSNGTDQERPEDTLPIP